MSRDLPIGNGAILVAYNCDAQLREFHFPFVGEENHAGEPFQFGVFTDGKMHYLPEGWQIQRDYLDDTLAARIELTHEELGLRIESNDVVDFEKNVYLKRIRVENLRETPREVRLILSHGFHLSGNNIGDTAAYKPDAKSLLHYKRDRYFLINVYANHKFGIDEYATGDANTWKDAEDGMLSRNPIAQGSVGSVLAIPLSLGAKESETCYYWIAVGANWKEVKDLNIFVKKKTPEEIFQRTVNYWKCWVDKEQLDLSLLPQQVGRLYKRSLFICRTQINNCGSIIAANDSDAIRFNRDTYSYTWPRDGALISYGLDLAGYDSAPFFQFCANILEEDGYFLHKYLPSGSLGSSWHPWLKQQKAQLPIQEDGTALVLWALWKHYKQYRDLEFIRRIYHCLIIKAADFLMNYRNPKTKLPLPSYDLWEERQGILTFTAATVYGGLMAASNFAKLFYDESLSEEYAKGALEMKEAMERYLYLPKEQRFARMIEMDQENNVRSVDAAIDASLYAVFAFGAFSPDDEKVVSTMRQIEEKLKVGGGIIRYENDSFYRQAGALPNPWFVTTLWIAQYRIAKARTKQELDQALEILDWVASKAMPSGVLSEQINPDTGSPLSVSPLTWSHGTFIATVQEYINKFIDLDRCSHCNQPKIKKNRRCNNG